MKHLECIVIGNTARTKKIAELLFDSGQPLIYVISTEATLLTWCDENTIECAPRLEDINYFSHYYYIIVDDPKLAKRLAAQQLQVLSNDNLAINAAVLHATPLVLLAVWHCYQHGAHSVHSQQLQLENTDHRYDAYEQAILSLFSDLIVDIARDNLLTTNDTTKIALTEKITLDRLTKKLITKLAQDYGCTAQQIVTAIVISIIARYFCTNKLPIQQLLNPGEGDLKLYLGSMIVAEYHTVSIACDKSIVANLPALLTSIPNTPYFAVAVDNEWYLKKINTTEKNTSLSALTHFFICTEDSIAFYVSAACVNIAYWQALYASLQQACLTLPSSLYLAGADYLAIPNQYLAKWPLRVRQTAHRQTVLQQFISHAQTTPEAIAIVYTDRSLTYAHLDRLSDQCANYLRAHILARQSVVAIALAKDELFFVAVLAVLKCQGIYLPIDLSLPDPRIQYYLHDSGADCLLTNADYVDRFSNYYAKVINTDQIYPTATPANDPSPMPAELDDNCYLIYTSGSTGQPKGVLLTHRGLAELIDTQKNNFQITRESRILQFASVAFDASVLEWALALASGATLIIVDNKQMLGEALLDYLIKQAITFVHLPPTVLATLTPRPLPALQSLVVGGEACPQSVVTQWASNVPLYNSYGPTENTVCATLHRFRPGDNAKSIGLPLAHVSAYIINHEQQICPVGVIGELVLGGLALATGYIKQHSKTQEKFTQIPSIVESRLYRTGDLVRRQQDGTIEYIGRSDTQVNLRGFRIELDEIAHVAQHHAEVSQAKAIVVGEADKALIQLYYVSQSKQQITSQLRAHLHAHLPVYMLPSRYFYLASWPMTTNGKIDIAALAAMTTNAEPTTPFIPSDRLAAKVLEIFLTVLEVETLGAMDNFLHSGGNSLRAVHLLATIAEELQITIPLAYFFDNPSLHAVLAYLQIHPPVASRTLVKYRADKPQPLSYAQNRLWFLYEFEGRTSSTYNIPCCYRLEGALEVSKLAQAVNFIIARHDILRTVFHIRQGQAQQHILPNYKLDLLPEASTEEELAEKISSLCHQPFELTKSPPFRVKLFSLKANDYILCIVQHNIITDGWSIGLLLKELSHCYNQLCVNKAPQLPTLKYQYVDFCHWQRLSMQEAGIQRAMAYWVDNLAGFSELQLPTDFPRPAVLTTAGDNYNYHFGNELSLQLSALAKNNLASLYMVVLSGFALLLNRYSNDDDFIIGTGVASRDLLALEKMLGFFVNTLPLRVKIDNSCSFIDFLATMKRCCVDAYSAQAIPFDKIVDNLRLTREADRLPLFQVMFMFQDAADDAKFELNHCKTAEIRIPLKTAMFDLTFNVYHRAGQIDFSLQYNTNLYKRQTVECFMQRLERLFINIVRDPMQPLHALKLISSAEQQQLTAYNNTDYSWPVDDLQSLLLDSLHTYGNKLALVDSHMSLSYLQLEHKSNQLARKIIASVGDLAYYQQTIVVALDKSTELVIAWLAILKLGATYVPVDPNYPMARLAYILEDTAACCMLGHTLVTAGHQFNVPLIDLAAISEFAANKIVNSRRTKHSLAYIIYTSGSTGKPKGVCISDGNLVNLLLSFKHELNFCQQHKFLSLTNPTFDIFALELFLPLITGATCYLIKKSQLLEPTLLARQIKRIAPDFIQATPSLWSLAIGELLGQTFAATVLVGGEAMTDDLAANLLKIFTTVYNVYGPTETTVWSTLHKLTTASQSHIIGRPIHNTQTYVVDAQGDLLPNNISGELLIGGSGVSLGYLRDAEKTQQQFIELPAISATTLYKTGDRVWRDDTGLLHYVNRMDDQLKIRGHRVEPGEIETQLIKHPAIEQAVVIVPKQSGNIYTIYAFYKLTSAAGNVIDEQALTDHLAQYLPPYMLPTSYVQLAAFPLTANGKINRQGLQTRIQGRDSLTDSFVEATTENEKRLAKIFAAVLPMHRISCTANFFVCGGHSLLVPRVVMQINEEFATQITIRDFIQHPSIEKLQRFIHKSNTKIAINNVEEPYHV